MSESLSYQFKVVFADSGLAIAKPEEGIEDHTGAFTTNGVSEAAVFTLKDCKLQCGDFVLGRFRVEDRSLAPKRVYWFKDTEAAQAVFVNNVDGKDRISFGGAVPFVQNGSQLFAQLLPNFVQEHDLVKV